jgi:hypothetical protein
MNILKACKNSESRHANVGAVPERLKCGTGTSSVSDPDPGGILL